jgi:mannose-1-phosphate guanylyltransferase
MKAFLLAGGRGERLQPLTLSTPKCLAPINGHPLLGIWLDLLGGAGVDEVLLNVSHHEDQVRAFIRSRSEGPSVHLVVEPEPRGNAGTVAAERWFVEGEDSFWVFYADNLTNMALEPLLRRHRAHDGVLTMGLFRAPDPRAAGIVVTGDDGRVVAFEEKPAEPGSDLANAGVYIARRGLLDVLPAPGGILDFGLHVFPRLVGQIYAFPVEGFLMDIGTPQALARASDAWLRLENRTDR